MTSPLGFKARVGSALSALGGGIHAIHSLRFTSGVTPLLVYNACIAASHLPHMHISTEMRCWDLNCRPPARQSDALSNQPRRPARIGKFNSKLPIIISQINSISLIESEKFWETSTGGFNRIALLYDL